MTDELTMGAIANYWGVDRAAVLALMAGNDLLMMADYSAAISFRDQMLAAWDNGWSATVNDLAGNPQNISYTKEQIRERITDAVRRILRIKQLSHIDSFTIIQDIQNASEPDWAAHHSLAAQVPALVLTEVEAVDDSLSPCLTGVGSSILP